MVQTKGTDQVAKAAILLVLYFSDEAHVLSDTMHTVQWLHVCMWKFAQYKCCNV